jgi:hypothetical protein
VGLDVVECPLEESAGVGLVPVKQEQVGRPDGEGQELSGLCLGPDCGPNGAISDAFGDVRPEVPFNVLQPRCDARLKIGDRGGGFEVQDEDRSQEDGRFVGQLLECMR